MQELILRSFDGLDHPAPIITSTIRQGCYDELELPPYAVGME